MADYIYTMETRLTPEQMRVVNLVQQIARSHGMNVYLTGGAIRDILTGFPIRDLDFTVQGNPLTFRAELEKAGGIVDLADQTLSVIHVVLQGTRAEISMARSEVFDKPGKPPKVTPTTINEDLKRRDFTFNAMALSLNEGSRGLLLDPFNGAADIEMRLVRVLHSYAFLEDPSRLIRATRFATRFGYELEDRTRARYDSAREGEYIQYIGHRAIGYEVEQIAQEENPIAVMKALEAEGWLKVLEPKWTVAKADTPELARLLKTRSTMADFNISVDAAPAVMHFLTHKLGESVVSAIQAAIPHREFVASWKRLEAQAKELSKSLLSKEASTNSGTWQILSAAKPEALLYLDVTGKNKTVDDKIKNFFGKWRQLQQNIPVAKMAEMRITPQLPEYPEIYQKAFMLLLDGKLRSEAEIVKFLTPYEPPLPPPPPQVRRGRAAGKKLAVVKKAPVEEIAAEAKETPAPAAQAVEAKAEKSAKAEKPAKAEKKEADHKAKSAAPAKAAAPKPVAAKPAPSKAPAKKASKPVAKPAAKPAVAKGKAAHKPVAAARPKKAPAKPVKAAKKVVKPSKPAPKPQAKAAKKAPPAASKKKPAARKPVSAKKARK